MKKENGNVKKKKHFLRKLLGITAAFFAAVIGMFALACRKNMKKMKACEGEHNMMHSILAGNKSLVAGEKINNIFLCNVMGNLILDMTKNPIENDINVSVISIAGNVEIKVPRGVKLDLSGKDCMGNLACNASGAEDGSFAININREAYCSNLVIVEQEA